MWCLGAPAPAAACMLAGSALPRDARRQDPRAAHAPALNQAHAVFYIYIYIYISNCPSGPCAAEGRAFRGTASFAGITTDVLADGESVSEEWRDSGLTATTSYPSSEAVDQRTPPWAQVLTVFQVQQGGVWGFRVQGERYTYWSFAPGLHDLFCDWLSPHTLSWVLVEVGALHRRLASGSCC